MTQIHFSELHFQVPVRDRLQRQKVWLPFQELAAVSAHPPTAQLIGQCMYRSRGQLWEGKLVCCLCAYTCICPASLPDPLPICMHQPITWEAHAQSKLLGLSPESQVSSLNPFALNHCPVIWTTSAMGSPVHGFAVAQNTSPRQRCALIHVIFIQDHFPLPSHSLHLCPCRVQHRNHGSPSAWLAVVQNH